MKIEDGRRRLADLKPDPENPRGISVEARARLKAGLELFGCVEPLIVDERNLLIGGHQRRDLLIELGHDEVPVRIVSDLTPAERRTLMVLLNNAEAQGTFRLPDLAQILGAIREDAPDLVPFTGFASDFLDSLGVSGKGRKPAGAEIRAPRPYTWVLAAIPTARYHEVAAEMEGLARRFEVCEVMASERGP